MCIRDSTRDTVCFSAPSDVDKAQFAVVHVHAAFEENAALADIQLVALLHMVCLLYTSCSEWRWKETAFSDCDLRKSQLLHTSLNGMDLRSCELDGFRLAPQDLNCLLYTSRCV